MLLYSNEPNKMIKYRIDTKLSGVPFGETAFGQEELYADERECVYHKWCGIKAAESSLYVVNKGIYGGSFTDSTIKLSLLRTPLYAAHPIKQRQIAPHDRFIKHMDMGEREFSFRITTEPDIAREAQIYNEAPQLLSFFPSGDGEPKISVVTVDDPDIILSSVKKKGDGYEMTLFNASGEEKDAEVVLHVKQETRRLRFGKYELKMVEI